MTLDERITEWLTERGLGAVAPRIIAGACEDGPEATEVALADAFVACFLDREEGRDLSNMAPLLEALAAVLAPVASGEVE